MKTSADAAQVLCMLLIRLTSGKSIVSNGRGVGDPKIPHGWPAINKVAAIDPMIAGSK